MTVMVGRQVTLLTATALCLAIAGDARQARDSGVLSGRGFVSGVVISGAGPVAEATVTLTGTTWRRLTTTTTVDGQFTLAGVPPDVYVLSASKDEYLDAVYGTSRPTARGGMATGIVVAAGHHVDRLSVTLARGGVISGVIRHQDGRPAAAITVTLAPRHRAGIAGMAATDASGRFRIAGLIHGDYDVIAYPSTDDVPVYFPGVTNPARAESVGVEEDAPARHVEFALVPGAPVRVSGVVRDDDGDPAGGAYVNAMSQTGLLLQATTTSGGRFDLDRVPPGRYRIEARAPARSAAASATPARGRWAAADVEVGVEGIADLDLRLRALRIFAGRLAFDRPASSPGIDPATIRVFLTRPGFHPAEVTVEADGSFVHAAEPGLHLVSAVASGTTLRLRSAIAGARDLLDEPPTFDASIGDVTDVILTFTDRDTGLSGRVLGADDKSVSGCYVVAFATDRATWTEHSRRLMVVRPATDGRFVIRDLPQGAYYVVAIVDLDLEVWRTPEFLSRLAATATQVVIGEDRPTLQNLRIQNR
jgi:hypothetical protein